MATDLIDSDKQVSVYGDVWSLCRELIGLDQKGFLCLPDSSAWRGIRKREESVV